MTGESLEMVSHYQVLGLPRDVYYPSPISSRLLKAAYRRALLRHHPDKAQSLQSPAKTSLNIMAFNKNSEYSIDEITKAYAVLSTPGLRAEYDRELQLLQSSTTGNGPVQKEAFRTGIETVDLDDLQFDEKASVWFRSCRCGEERGFLIQESDLEEASQDGELNLGCKGCSLWLRVMFGVVEDAACEETCLHKGHG